MIYDSVPPPSIFEDKRDIRLVDIAKRIEPDMLETISNLLDVLEFEYGPGHQYEAAVNEVQEWIKLMRGLIEREGRR